MDATGIEPIWIDPYHRTLAPPRAESVQSNAKEVIAMTYEKPVVLAT